jgi:Tfp pilus assembly protein PilO
VKRNELTIIVALGAIGLVIAFWLLVISPKRNEAGSLKNDVDQLHAELSQAQQAVEAGDQARKSFPIDYRRLVVLGKAVPSDGEQGSLLVQLQQLADRAGVGFQSIDLSASAGATTTPPTEAGAVASTDSPSTTDSSSSSTTTSSSSDSTTSDSTSTSTSDSSSAPSSTATTATTAPATEAGAANLPIGASVGPAGLPVMPYDLKFTGGFFQIANFLHSVDGLVHSHDGLIDVNGRLMTVDAFTLSPVQTEPGSSFNPVPTLTADLSVTTYLTPADQGLTAGASPGGPATATATPTASATSTPAPTSTPTATATP